LNRILLSLLLLLLVDLAGCEKAQNVPLSVPVPSTNIAVAPTDSPKPAEGPPPRAGRLDLKATAVDVRKDIDGQPADEVLDALLRLNVDKNKYESDAQHGKRMKELVGSRLLDDVAVGDLVGFRPIKVQFEYDANKGLWTYRISPKLVRRDFNNFLVYKQLLDAQNFPAYAKFYRGRDLEFSKDIYLRISGLKGFSSLNGAAKVAAALDGALSVLLVGRLIPEYVSEAQAIPADYTDRSIEFQHTLGFKLEAVWLVNMQTDQILSKTWTVRSRP
jgi:hypothetical protein